MTDIQILLITAVVVMVFAGFLVLVDRVRG